MSKTYEFLMECGVFFIATINGKSPAVRPFGGVMEYEEMLYFSTAKNKDVYSQLIFNQWIQVVALKADTRNWIRVDGVAVEVFDLGIKQKMLDTCPRLIKHFSSNDCEHFALFKIDKMESSLNVNGEFIKLT